MMQGVFQTFVYNGKSELKESQFANCNGNLREASYMYVLIFEYDT